MLFPLNSFCLFSAVFGFTYLLQTGSTNKCLTQHKIEYGMSQNISKNLVNIAKGVLKVVRLTYQTHRNIRGLQDIGG